MGTIPPVAASSLTFPFLHAPIFSSWDQTYDHKVTSLFNLAWKEKTNKKSISCSVAKCQSKMSTWLYAKKVSLPAGSRTERQHLVSHCWLHVPNTPLWLTAQGHQYILFIEALTWDLLFPLAEEAWTLIKHLVLRTCVQQWKSSRKEAITRETQRRIGKLSVPFSKKKSSV